MKDNNGNLTKAELTAVDSMIVYLTEHNKTTMDKTFDSIYGANSNCFNVATPQSVAIQTAQQAVQEAAQQAQANYMTIPAITNVPTIYATSTCISGLVGMGTGALKQGAPQLESLFERLSGGKSELTLDELIAIRNKNK